MTSFRSHRSSLPQLPAAQFGEGGDVESSNKKLYAALAAEFLGMLLFALYGGEARDSAAACGCLAWARGSIPVAGDRVWHLCVVI